MANKVTVTQREIDIAMSIRGACSQILDPVDDINARKDALGELNKSLVDTKLGIMRTIAEMSSADKWLPGEIKNATSYAAKRLTNTSNDDDADERSAKSLATFMSEMNAVAHPKVRDRYVQIQNAVLEAWRVEEENMALPSDERDAMPVRKWASRKYHAVMGCLRAVKNDEADITSADDVIAFAVENDPDFDPDKVAKRLESVAKTLHGIFADFGNEDIGQAARYVEAITAKDLLESLKVKNIAKAKAQAEQRKLNPTPAPTVKPAPIVTPSTKAPTTPTTSEAGTPAEGAFDPLADVLNDVNMIEALAA